MTATEIIDGIRQKRRQQDRLLSMLETWAVLKSQGVAESEVEAFGWEPTKAQRPWLRFAMVPAGSWDRPRDCPEWVGPWLLNSGQPRWLNFAKLKDGRRVHFEPTPNTFADPDRTA